MKGFLENIEKLSVENTDYRRVLYTGKNLQLVLMSLKPGEEIGEEVHNLDQFIRVETGSGKAILDGLTREIGEGSAMLVPAGARHNIVNTGAGDMKLYTLYGPPNHKNKTVHTTKTDAENSDEHFDGNTSE